MEDKLEVFCLGRFVAECERPSAPVAKPAKNFLILFIRLRGSSGQKSGFIISLSLSSVRRRMKEMRRLRFVISYLISICVERGFLQREGRGSSASCISFAVLDI